MYEIVVFMHENKKNKKTFYFFLLLYLITNIFSTKKLIDIHFVLCYYSIMSTGQDYGLPVFLFNERWYKMEYISKDILKDSIKSHYQNKDYTEVVRDALLCLATEIRKKSDLNDKDGINLINTAFSEKNPLIKIN